MKGSEDSRMIGSIPATDPMTVSAMSSAPLPAPVLALLAKLVNLGPVRLAANSAARTGLHHMGVFVIRRAPDHLAVLGMRSAAGSLWHALDTAAAREAAVAA